MCLRRIMTINKLVTKKHNINKYKINLKLDARDLFTIVYIHIIYGGKNYELRFCFISMWWIIYKCEYDLGNF